MITSRASYPYVVFINLKFGNITLSMLIMIIGNFQISEVNFALFLDKKYEFLSRNVSTSFYENILNHFYTHMIIVGIPYIYLFSHLILPLYKCVDYAVRSRHFIMIWNYNVPIIRINLFIHFNSLNLIIIKCFGGWKLDFMISPGLLKSYRP